MRMNTHRVHRRVRFSGRLSILILMMIALLSERASAADSLNIMRECFVPKIGRVRVVNVHLTNWEFEHHIRAKQISETMKWLEDRQSKVPAAVTFLGGDFNAKRQWTEMKPLDETANKALVFQ